MWELRFAQRPKRAPLAITDRIAHWCVKVCAATRPDLDAPSTVRHWDENGGHFLGRLSALVGWVIDPAWLTR